MFQYFFKRLFYFLPTLLIISLVGFGLSKMAPGDPVENFWLAKGIVVDEMGSNYDIRYQESADKLGLDCPSFYVSFTAKAYPDSLHKISNYARQEALSKLVGQYGNWNLIENYFHSLQNFQQRFEQAADEISRTKIIEIRRPLAQLFIAYKDGAIESKLTRIQQKIQLTSTATKEDSSAYFLLGEAAQQLSNSYQKVKNTPSKSLLNIPVLRWNGFDNQYHHWISRFVRGDFGRSNSNGGKSVLEVLKIPIFWTFILSMSSLLIIFLIAIPLGVLSAAKRNTVFDRISTIVVFILFSLPTFWIATMAVIFFTTPEYGMKIFPSIGLADIPSNASFWERFSIRSADLILPIACMVYPSLAFISRQVRGGMNDIIEQDFIRTAYAKGLSKKAVINKHAFRNALFPLITIFAGVLPSLIVGSVVVEIIFNIPGMGKVMLDSIHADDWNVVFTILLLLAFLTLIGNFIADLLYAYVDPRVSFD